MKKVIAKAGHVASQLFLWTHTFMPLIIGGITFAVAENSDRERAYITLMFLYYVPYFIWWFTHPMLRTLWHHYNPFRRKAPS